MIIRVAEVNDPVTLAIIVSELDALNISYSVVLNDDNAYGALNIGVMPHAYIESDEENKVLINEVISNLNETQKIDKSESEAGTKYKLQKPLIIITLSLVFIAMLAIIITLSSIVSINNAAFNSLKLTYKYQYSIDHKLIDVYLLRNGKHISQYIDSDLNEIYEKSIEYYSNSIQWIHEDKNQDLIFEYSVYTNNNQKLIESFDTNNDSIMDKEIIYRDGKVVQTIIRNPDTNMWEVE